MGKLTWNPSKLHPKNSAKRKSNTKKKSRPSPTNLRTPKPEPNSPKRPSSSLKRTSTNLKIPSTLKNAKSEQFQKTWTIPFKELETYKYVNLLSQHYQLLQKVILKECAVSTRKQHRTLWKCILLFCI